MSQIPEPNIGLRIRSLRERDGLSLRALSERCGLSINAISQIERGENSPTVSSLRRLASALHVPITDFFYDEEKQVAVFVKRDLGFRVRSDTVVMESLGIGLINQQLEPFRAIIEPGRGNENDPITHPGEEFIYCLEGEVDYCVGDKAFHLEQEDSLLFEAAEPHAYHNASPRRAIILMIFQSSQDPLLARQLHLDI
ncbi:MAG TPA: cupin domain-containing protein [Anaerolineales bacterium]|jgi:transcriptional regulator with XRE-family HTH domain|nr:cupin domain-containing protein [Anaerolineales bacterium]